MMLVAAYELIRSRGVRRFVYRLLNLVSLGNAITSRMLTFYAPGLLLWLTLSYPFYTHAQSVPDTLNLIESDNSTSSYLDAVASSMFTSTASNTSISTSPATAAHPTASSTQYDVLNNMCWRFFHQSTIKNGSLYIDGGIQSFLDYGTDRWAFSGNTTQGYNTRLIKIDLSRQFDWKNYVSRVALNKSADPDTNNMPPLVSHATLYSGAPQDSRIWLYGGTTLWWNTEFPGFEGPTTDIYSLWSYDTATERWDQYDVRPESLMRPSYGLAAEAPELGLGFYFNGQIDSGSSQQTQSLNSYPKLFLEGMIMINTTSQTAFNISTDAAVGGLPRTRGGAAYIPGIGGSGILAVMGGTYKPSASLDGQEMTSFANMGNITIFDVGAYLRNNSEQLWYSQNATGEIPEPRAYFCTVMVSAPDSSSHNIYLYSGQGPNNLVYDDIYVLSIPSFTWTKVFNGSSPRFGQTCHKVGNQMITVGGKDKVDLAQQLPCDWEEAGIGILNMSDLQWGSQFLPEDQTGPYSVPGKVQEQILE